MAGTVEVAVPAIQVAQPRRYDSSGDADLIPVLSPEGLVQVLDDGL